MNTWVLVILFGITWAGAGGARKIDFPDEGSCYKALESMRIEAVGQTHGDDDEQVIAYCQPKKETTND